jgi:hypothetical protein
MALGVFIWAMTFQFPVLDDGHPGPSLFPRVLGNPFYLLRVTRRLPWMEDPASSGGAPAGGRNSLNYFNPILVIILIAVFIALANKLGFIISGVAILFILMMKLRVSLLKRSIISVALVCFVSLSSRRSSGFPCQSVY